MGGSLRDTLRDVLFPTEAWVTAAVTTGANREGGTAYEQGAPPTMLLPSMISMRSEPSSRQTPHNSQQHNSHSGDSTTKASDYRSLAAAASLAQQRIDYFGWLAFFVVFLNLVALALYDPLTGTTRQRNSASLNNLLSNSEYFFVAFFLLEITLRFYCLGALPVLRTWTGVLDSIIVLLSLITLILQSILPQIGSLAGLRAVRVLRPLRAITRIPEVRVVVNSMMKSLVHLGSVGVLFVVFIVAMSCGGLVLFGGQLQAQCVRNEYEWFRPSQDVAALAQSTSLDFSDASHLIQELIENVTRSWHRNASMEIVQAIFLGNFDAVDAGQSKSSVNMANHSAFATVSTLMAAQHLARIADTRNLSSNVTLFENIMQFLATGWCLSAPEGRNISTAAASAWCYTLQNSSTSTASVFTSESIRAVLDLLALRESNNNILTNQSSWWLGPQRTMRSDWLTLMATDTDFVGSLLFESLTGVLDSVAWSTGAPPIVDYVCGQGFESIVSTADPLTMTLGCDNTMLCDTTITDGGLGWFGASAVAGYPCPFGYTCRSTTQSPLADLYQFDHFGFAVLSVLVIVTTEIVPSGLYLLAGATSRVSSLVFILTTIVFGTLFIVNLLVALISIEFEHTHDLERKRRRELKALVTSRTGRDDDESWWTVMLRRRRARHKEVKMMLQASLEESPPSSSSIPSSTLPPAPPTIAEVAAQPTASETFRHKVATRIVHTKAFLVITSLLMIAMLIVMAIPFYSMPTAMSDALDILNIFFTACITGEMLLRFSAADPILFFSDVSQLIGTMVVIVSWVDVGVTDINIPMVRVVRLSIAVKLLRYFPTLYNHIRIVAKSFRASLVLMLVIALEMFTFACLGMQLFGGRFCPAATTVTGPTSTANASFVGHVVNFSLSNQSLSASVTSYVSGEYVSLSSWTAASPVAQLSASYIADHACVIPRLNFDTFPYAMLTAFSMLAQDNWYNTMYAVMATYNSDSTSGRALQCMAAVFFVMHVFVGVYVLLNLFIAILMNATDQLFLHPFKSMTEEEEAMLAAVSSSDSDDEDKDATSDDEDSITSAETSDKTREGLSKDEQRRQRTTSPREHKITSGANASRRAGRSRSNSHLFGRDVAVTATSTSPLQKPLMENWLEEQLPSLNVVVAPMRLPQPPSPSVAGPRPNTAEAPLLFVTERRSVPLSKVSAPSSPTTKGNSSEITTSVPSRHVRRNSISAKMASDANRSSSSRRLVRLDDIQRLLRKATVAQRRKERMTTVHAQMQARLQADVSESASWLARGRRALHDVLEHPAVGALMVGVVAVSTVALAMEESQLPPDHSTMRTLRIVDDTCSVIFIAEFVLRVIAKGPQRFFLWCWLMAPTSPKRSKPSGDERGKRGRSRSRSQKSDSQRSSDRDVSTVTAAVGPSEETSEPENSSKKPSSNSSKSHPKLNPRQTAVTPWGWFELLLCTSNVVDIVLSHVFEADRNAAHIVRLLYILRPLRIVRRSPGVRVVLRSVLNALSPLKDVVLVTLVGYVLFAVAGLSLFMGALQLCVEAPTQFTTIDACTAAGYHWGNPEGSRNFDNIGEALLSLFVVGSLEGWQTVLYAVMDYDRIGIAPSRDATAYQAWYVITFAIVGGFFFANFFASVLVRSFHEEKQRMHKWSMFLTESQEKWFEMHTMVLASMPLTDFLCVPESERKYLTTVDWIRDKCIRMTLHSAFRLFADFGVIVSILASAIQHTNSPSSFKTLLLAGNVVAMIVFTTEFAVKIVAARPEVYFSSSWNRFDFLFTLLSITDVVLSVCGFEDTSNLTRSIQLLRAARLLRLAHMSRRISKILSQFATCLYGLSNVAAFLTLFVVTFALTTMWNFGTVQKDGSTLTVYQNFDTFMHSVFSLITLLFGGDWSLMDACSVEDKYRMGVCDHHIAGCGNRAYATLIFVPYFLMGRYVFLHIFVAVIVEAFRGTASDDDESDKSSGYGVKDDKVDNVNNTDTSTTRNKKRRRYHFGEVDLQLFVEAWSSVDIDKRLCIPGTRLLDVLDRLPVYHPFAASPLYVLANADCEPHSGLPVTRNARYALLRSHFDRLRFVSSLGLVEDDHGHGTVEFFDVLTALMRVRTHVEVVEAMIAPAKAQFQRQFEFRLRYRSIAQHFQSVEEEMQTLDEKLLPTPVEEELVWSPVNANSSRKTGFSSVRQQQQKERAVLEYFAAKYVLLAWRTLKCLQRQPPTFTHHRPPRRLPSPAREPLTIRIDPNSFTIASTEVSPTTSANPTSTRTLQNVGEGDGHVVDNHNSASEEATFGFWSRPHWQPAVKKPPPTSLEHVLLFENNQVESDRPVRSAASPTFRTPRVAPAHAVRSIAHLIPQPVNPMVQTTQSAHSYSSSSLRSPVTRELSFFDDTAARNLL